MTKNDLGQMSTMPRLRTHHIYTQIYSYCLTLRCVCMYTHLCVHMKFHKIDFYRNRADGAFQLPCSSSTHRRNECSHEVSPTVINHALVTGKSSVMFLYVHHSHSVPQFFPVGNILILMGRGAVPSHVHPTSVGHRGPQDPTTEEHVPKFQAPFN